MRSSSAAGRTRVFCGVGRLILSIGVKTVPLRNSSIVLWRIFSIGCPLRVFLRSTRSNERPLCLRGLPIYGLLNSVTLLLLWFAETCVWVRPALLRSFFTGTCEGIQYSCRSSVGYRNPAAGDRNLQNREAGDAGPCPAMIVIPDRYDSRLLGKKARSGSLRHASS